MSKALNSIKNLIKGIVLHWTAGSYTSTYDSYHFCITFDESSGKARVVQTRSVKSVGAHTWKRNTGRIGISLCSEFNKNFPTKPDQIEKMSKLVAELSIRLDLDLNGSHKDFDLYSSKSIDIPNLADHLWYAKQDKYVKIDIGRFMDVVKSKALWYRSQLVSGKIKYEFVDQVF